MTDAIELHYEIAGPADAPVLVLGGSLGSSLAMWDAQATALAERYRVVRYDLRGHGRSPVPPGPYTIADLGGDVVALLDRLGVERAHLGGLSLGGMIALWAGAHHPERVDRVVACCTAACLEPPEQWTDRAATVRARGTDAVADAVVERWVTPGYAARYPERVARLRDMVRATPDEGYAGCSEAIAGMDLRAALADLVAPTLVVAAADDPATPPSYAEEIASLAADARVAVVDGAAHLAAVERPEAVTDLIAGHLEPQGTTHG